MAYYGRVLSTLGDRQILVYKKLQEGGEWTNTEIAVALNRPINTITPRVKELRDKGLVGEACIRRCRITGMHAKAWIAIDYGQKERA
jgi:DNA-binding Lrp family transcriptional regulator